NRSTAPRTGAGPTVPRTAPPMPGQHARARSGFPIRALRRSPTARLRRQIGEELTSDVLRGCACRSRSLHRRRGPVAPNRFARGRSICVLFAERAQPYHRGMITGPNTMAEVAALVGDPARANILDTLLDGRAFTATELAFAAKVGAPTASAHLGKLVDARLLSVVKQGRHRYYRLASPLVARMLEGIMVVAAIETPPRYRPRTSRDEALLLGRTCYDHLAGRLGVGIADALVARSHVILSDDAGEVTAEGVGF